MSTRSDKDSGGGGLSIATLVIASVSSVTAAYFIHRVWQGGAILGAAFTPVIVAIVSESLKRPTQRLTAIREERRQRGSVARRTPDEVPAAPPPELERPDPFGIWEAEQPRRFHWVHGRALKIAVATGLLGFVIAAFVVTSADLVFGDGSGGDRFTIVPGKQERTTTTEDEETTTEPAETTPTAPEEEQVPPAETAPQTTPQTTPTVPPATTPPATTTPAPTPEQPAPQQPAPQPVP